MTFATAFAAHGADVSYPWHRGPGGPNAARLWASVVPDSRVLWLKQVGHLPWLEDPSVSSLPPTNFYAARGPLTQSASAELIDAPCAIHTG
jgi:hypothetical protein